MATGSLSSLGLGSDSVLSYDVIDKLRTADEKAQITPIDTKLSTNSTKKTDLTSITTLASTLKSATSSLADSTNYLQRSTSVSDDAVTVTADAGTNVQDFTLHVSTLAKQDIYQTTSFSSATSTFATSSDTLKLNLGGTDYEFSVSSTTTLTDLKDMINNKMSGKATASILNTGGTNPYRLIIKSNNTGSDNAITITSGNSSTLSALGLDSTDNHLQTATNASFTYNGVSISRSSNSITDLINGVTIKLNDTQTSGTNANVSITQDWTDVKSQLKTFVSSYNSLISNVEDAVSYNKDKSTAGVFQGVSQMVGLSKDLRSQLLSIDSSGRSLTDYGIKLNDAGTLEFDETTFNSKVSSNATDVQDFLMGSTTNETVSYTGSAISSGALNVTYGGLYINDTSIRFSTSSSATATDNAAALQKAINAAGLSGITASVGTNNNIIIKSSSGEDIAITGNSSTLSSLGLTTSTTNAQSTTTKGFFTNYNSLLDSYTKKSTGTLSLLSTYLDTEKTSLTTQRAKVVSDLDTKYETLATKFAKYDSIISKIKTGFQTLSNIISQTNNGS